MFASGEVVWASWRFVEEEDIPNLRHTNEVVGAYVTAVAGLHLYSYLDRLQERAIYCDTDSVLFVQPSDEAALVETGDVGTESVRIHRRICQRRAEKLRVQVSRFCHGRAKDGL